MRRRGGSSARPRRKNASKSHSSLYGWLSAAKGSEVGAQESEAWATDGNRRTVVVVVVDTCGAIVLVRGLQSDEKKSMTGIQGWVPLQPMT